MDTFREAKAVSHVQFGMGYLVFEISVKDIREPIVVGAPDSLRVRRVFLNLIIGILAKQFSLLPQPFRISPKIEIKHGDEHPLNFFRHPSRNPRRIPFRDIKDLSKQELAGLVLRLRRHFHGATQKALAEMAGVRESHLSDLESGKHRPRKLTLRRIERAFYRLGKGYGKPVPARLVWSLRPSVPPKHRFMRPFPVPLDFHPVLEGIQFVLQAKVVAHTQSPKLGKCAASETKEGAPSELGEEARRILGGWRSFSQLRAPSPYRNSMSSLARRVAVRRRPGRGLSFLC